MDTEFFEQAEKQVHDFWELLTNLDDEVADMILGVLKMIRSAKNSDEMMQYFVGVLQTIRLIRHNVCPTCSVNHDDDDSKSLSETYREMFEKMGVDASTPDDDRIGTYL